jgi:hypothetical protein
MDSIRKLNHYVCHRFNNDFIGQIEILCDRITIESEKDHQKSDEEKY